MPDLSAGWVDLQRLYESLRRYSWLNLSFSTEFQESGFKQEDIHESSWSFGLTSSRQQHGRTIKAVLDATGLEKEFIKLIDYAVAPCKACLGCVKTNRCVIEDDGILLAEKAKEASALIIGGFTPYSSLDSRTKAFIERLYPLRHVHGFMRGKPGGAVITCAIPPGR